MYILGLGGSDHDVSATLIKDGQIVCAIEEERVTRKKYGFNSNLIYGSSRKYCLQSEGLKLSDVDLIVADEILPQTVLFSVKNCHKVNHHLLHAASTFYPSGFEEAAILVVDNAGSLVEWNGKQGLETLTYAHGKGKEINILKKIIGEKYKSAMTINKQVYQTGDPNNSLGYFYKLISHYCRFDFIVNQDYYFTEDGKTMGLAPYGTDKYYSQIRSFVKLMDNGEFEIDLHSGGFESFLKEITEKPLEDKEKDLKRRADIAYAGQKILEEALLHAANHLYDITKCPNLCIAGGVGLNSVANGKILKETPFKRLFVQPASGDSGTSIGAAMWGYYKIADHPRETNNKLTMKNAYLGRSYTEKQIEESLKKFSDCDIEWDKPEDLLHQTAKLISEDMIVGWFQGGSEFGPRALGNRSILANPTKDYMKDHVNAQVKFREGFRPFAPSVIYEYQSEYFELEQESPFMLIVAKVHPDKRSVIPAITHVDGSARLQSVTKENGAYYELINEFRKITGVPVVLNTSFNIKGEPIVESPEDAIKCFIGTKIDYLAIGPYLVKKKQSLQRQSEENENK